jgi:hypothetical protein
LPQAYLESLEYEMEDDEEPGPEETILADLLVFAKLAVAKKVGQIGRSLCVVLC